MHTYRALTTPNGWSVGYWLNCHPNAPLLWNEVCFVETELAAACRANVLNGGTGAIYWKGFLSHEPVNHGEGRF